MLTTGRADVAESVRMLSLHGASQDAWDRYTDHGGWHYDIVAHGFKYNLSDIQSAIGIHQLHKLEQFVNRRAEQAALYNQELGGRDYLELPPDRVGCRHAWHLYIPRLNLDRLRVDRDEFIRALRRKDIGSSVHFIPIPLHPYFARLPLANHACPGALALYPRIASLPLYPGLTDEQILYIAGSVREILEDARKPRYLPAGAAYAPLAPEGTL
jgi:dTDP-4-amino-4,6-dideoxygalactose transaminase